MGFVPYISAIKVLLSSYFVLSMFLVLLVCFPIMIFVVILNVMWDPTGKTHNNCTSIVVSTASGQL